MGWGGGSPMCELEGEDCVYKAFPGRAVLGSVKAS